MTKKKTPPVPMLAVQTVEELEAATAVLDAFAEHGVDSITAARIYMLVALNGATTVGGIADALGLPFSTTSRLVWTMVEESRLVILVPHDTDRRKKLVTLK